MAERLSLGKCGIESDYLVVGWPRPRIEEGLEGNTLDDGDEALRLFERVGLPGEKGGIYPLAGSNSPEWLLGRGNHCEVVLDEPSVSTEHARLSYQGGVWVLEDLDSRNGTRCGGRPGVRTELSPGELIQLGNMILLCDVIES